MMKKKIKAKLSIILLFLAGFMILLYPTLSDQWNKFRDKKLKSEYTQSVRLSDEEALEKELEAASVYNKTLIGSTIPDAFSVRENESDPEYEGLLNINGDGMMGYVEIPSIDVSLPIYHYTKEEILRKGAGHLAGSSLPVGGSSTHTVISAHRGLPSAKMFTDLNLLVEGDIFTLHVLNQILTYEVDQIKVVEPDQTEDLGIIEGKDYATLLTCTPYGVNTQRLLVRGHRISTSQANQIKTTHQRFMKNPSLLVEVLCVLGGILLAALIVWIMDRLEKKKKERQNQSEKK